MIYCDNGFFLIVRHIFLSLLSMHTDESKVGDQTMSIPANAITYEERTEVSDLMARYSHYIDSDKPEAWARLFVDNGEFIIPDVGLHLRGYNQLFNWFTKDMIRPKNGPTLHFVGSTILVKMSDDVIHALSKNLVAIELSEKQTLADQYFPVLVSGMYEDEIVKTENGWRFLRRKGSSSLPVPQEFIY